MNYKTKRTVLKLLSLLTRVIIICEARLDSLYILISYGINLGLLKGSTAKEIVVFPSNLLTEINLIFGIIS